MDFFDQQGNRVDVTMQDLQNEAQQEYNYSLINELPQSSIWDEMIEDAVSDLM